MANTPILNLPVAVTLDGSEYVPIVQGNTTKRAQASLFDFAADSPASVEDAHSFWAGPTSGVAAPPSFREIVYGDLPSCFVSKFGAIGNGITDDTAAIQAALDSGEAAVYGTPGATYLVSFAGTQTLDGFAERYCLLLPNGVLFDLNGATIKIANLANATAIMSKGPGSTTQTIDCGVINGIVDCNGDNQTDSDPSSSMSAVLLYNTQRARLENLRFDNNRRYAVRMLIADQAYLNNLWCTGSDGDGFSLGISLGYEVTNSVLDNIRADNCTTAWGGSLQGNGILLCLQDCQVGKLIQTDCAGGAKLQDSSARVTIESVYVSGASNGTNNSGFKIQGGVTGTVANVSVGVVNTNGNYGYGLYVYACQDITIGSVISDGDATAGEEAAVHLAQNAVRVSIGELNVSNSGAVGVSCNGQDCTFGSVVVRNSGQTTSNRANFVLEDTSPEASGIFIGSLVSLDDQDTATASYGLYLKSGTSNINIGSLDINSTSGSWEGGQPVRDDGSTNYTVGGIISVKNFGAVGDGVTDDGPAFQAAHDALLGKGGAIYIPPSNVFYLINTTVACTKSIRWYGSDWFSNVLASTVNGQIMFTATAWHRFEYLNFLGLDAGANTVIPIKCLSSASSNNHSGLSHCEFEEVDRSYWSQYTNAVSIDDCVITGTTAGLYLENLTNSDIGDSFISNCTISGDTSTCKGIYAPSTSGLHITNCKFNSNFKHIVLSVGSNPVGDILISNCSIEGHHDDAITLEATSGTVTKTLITGCQFSSGDVTHIHIGSKAINTVITGCTFNSTSQTTGLAIEIDAGATDITITGNEFYQILSAIVAPDAPTGITMSGNRFCGTSATNTHVTNIFSGDLATALNNNASTKTIALSREISNSSDAAYVNAFSFHGNGTADVMITGTVQGVANAIYCRRVMVFDTTVTNLIAPASSGGAFDVQLLAGGGTLSLGIKRAAATGTSVTMYVQVTLDGYFDDVIQV